jgi:dTDP-glucose 4,6-dehydratase
VAWYLDNQDWVGHVTIGEYRHWVSKKYAGNQA